MIVRKIIIMIKKFFLSPAFSGNWLSVREKNGHVFYLNFFSLLLASSVRKLLTKQASKKRVGSTRVPRDHRHGGWKKKEKGEEEEEEERNKTFPLSEEEVSFNAVLISNFFLLLLLLLQVLLLLLLLLLLPTSSGIGGGGGWEQKRRRRKWSRKPKWGGDNM